MSTFIVLLLLSIVIIYAILSLFRQRNSCTHGCDGCSGCQPKKSIYEYYLEEKNKSTD